MHSKWHRAGIFVPGEGVLLAQHELWVLLPGGVVGPPRRCQCDVDFIGI